MGTLSQMFEEVCNTPSDNNEHCPTLHSLAKECNRITEFGVMFGRSTVSFLSARPKSLISYDIKKQDNIGHIETLASAEKIPFSFNLEDSRTIVIDDTDLLYIDTEHTYEQLRVELFRHGNKAQKYIILHDTAAFPEMCKAIDEFLEQGIFQIKEVFVNNNGLTVLERIDGK